MLLLRATSLILASSVNSHPKLTANSTCPAVLHFPMLEHKHHQSKSNSRTELCEQHGIHCLQYCCPCLINALQRGWLLHYGAAAAWTFAQFAMMINDKVCGSSKAAATIAAVGLAAGGLACLPTQRKPHHEYISLPHIPILIVDCISL